MRQRLPWGSDRHGSVTPPGGLAQGSRFFPLIVGAQLRSHGSSVEGHRRLHDARPECQEGSLVSLLFLRRKLSELSRSGATLIWLEGSKHETVTSVKLVDNRLILQLHGNVMRIVRFDRYSATRVGLQFWLKDRPGVLYRWDQVPNGTKATQDSSLANTLGAQSQAFAGYRGFDDDPPPNAAA